MMQEDDSRTTVLLLNQKPTDDHFDSVDEDTASEAIASGSRRW